MTPAHFIKPWIALAVAYAVAGGIVWNWLFS